MVMKYFRLGCVANCKANIGVHLASVYMPLPGCCTQSEKDSLFVFLVESRQTRGDFPWGMNVDVRFNQCLRVCPNDASE